MPGQTFKFPDETGDNDTTIDTSDTTKVEFTVEGDDEAGVQVVDDTPEADRGRTPSEPPPELTDEELSRYTDTRVKERLQHFSKGYHDERRAKEAAERERDEALRVAQTLVQEHKKLQSTANQGQQVLVEQAKTLAEKEVAAAEAELQAANDAFDTAAQTAAQKKLTQALLKLERVGDLRVPTPSTEPADVVQPQPRQQKQYHPKTAAWLSENAWFGKDEEMSMLALGVHKKLIAEGVDPTSDQYFARINKRMREVFPDAFPSGNTDGDPAARTRQPTKTVVAPATRSTAPNRIVLTKTQVALAKKLNIPLEEYARQQKLLG